MFEPDLKEYLLDDVAEIAATIDRDGEPHDIFPQSDITGRFFLFKFVYRLAVQREITRSDLSRVLDTVGALMLLDGPRPVNCHLEESHYGYVGALYLWKI